MYPTFLRPISIKPKKVYYKEDDDEGKSKRLSKRLSLFRSGDDGTDSRGPSAPRTVARGVVVQTFMGLATVRNVRSDSGMCEVRFVQQVMSGVTVGTPILVAGIHVTRQKGPP